MNKARNSFIVGPSVFAKLCLSNGGKFYQE